MMSAIDRVKNAAKTVSNVVTDPVGSVKEGVGNLISKIPGFQGGVTNFRGGLARVHEGEVITNLPRGSNVIPAHRVGGNSYTFNFPNYIGDKEELRQLINQARLDFERQGNG